MSFTPKELADIEAAGERWAAEGKSPVFRTFETGASRDLDDTKLDFEGFISPAVLREFAIYMHGKRQMPDGSVRDGDNWQKGIPLDAYMKSMARHFMDVWLHHRGEGRLAGEPLETALAGLFFNVQGYWFETLVDGPEFKPQPEGVPFKTHDETEAGEG